MDEDTPDSLDHSWYATYHVHIMSKTFLEHLESVPTAIRVCVVLYLVAYFFEFGERAYAHIVHHIRQLIPVMHNRLFPSHRLAASSEADDMDKHERLHHIESFALTRHEQSQSPLFSVLPAEIRDMIYAHTFAEYEDLENPYPFNTCYRRPGCFGPRKSDTALLRTCQAIYNDCWYVPWILAQQVFFLAWERRSPKKTMNAYEPEEIIRLVEKLHPNTPARRKEIASIQIFAQLLELEDREALTEILRVEQIRPRSVTITVRHTDIWSWESDVPISMHLSDWVWDCRFPTSVANICFQLESLERKKEQVDSIIAQIRQGWYFTRTDGVHLAPSVACPASETWTGSSTWDDERWIRDEDDREPGKIRYYIASLCFTPADMTDVEGRTGREERAKLGGLDVPQEVVDRTPAIRHQPPLYVGDMERASTTSDTPASEALRMVQQSNR